MDSGTDNPDRCNSRVVRCLAVDSVVVEAFRFIEPLHSPIISYDKTIYLPGDARTRTPGPPRYKQLFYH
jgi:hypothetical protein